MRMPLASCLRSCVVDVDLFYFFLVFLPFCDFDLDIVCFNLSFSCGYIVLSPRFYVSPATRLAYDVYLDTYYTYAGITF